jgi:hypothetical protein
MIFGLENIILSEVSQAQKTKNHMFLIHSSVVEHLSYFHSLVIMKNAAISMGVKVVLLYPALHSFRSGIAGPYGSSAFSF